MPGGLQSLRKALFLTGRCPRLSRPGARCPQTAHAARTSPSHRQRRAWQRGPPRVCALCPLSARSRRLPSRHWSPGSRCLRSEGRPPAAGRRLAPSILPRVPLLAVAPLSLPTPAPGFVLGRCLRSATQSSRSRLSFLQRQLECFPDVMFPPHP